MSRRRYISTSISIDSRIAALSDSAALLWTWMIPHAGEDATITGDTEELRWMVVPSRPHIDVEACLVEIERQGLVVRKEGVCYFDSEAFYRYQSNIHQDKRADHSALFSAQPRAAAENSEKQRKTAENTASLSLTPSPSPTPTPTENRDSAVDADAPTCAPDLFAEFWSVWPKHKGSKQLAAKRFKALTASQQRKAIAGAGYLAEALELGLIESVTYQPRAENFVGGSKRYFEEWAEGIPGHLTTAAAPRRTTSAIDQNFGALRRLASRLDREEAPA